MGSPKPKFCRSTWSGSIQPAPSRSPSRFPLSKMNEQQEPVPIAWLPLLHLEWGQKPPRLPQELAVLECCCIRAGRAPAWPAAGGAGRDPAGRERLWILGSAGKVPSLHHRGQTEGKSDFTSHFVGIIFFPLARFSQKLFGILSVCQSSCDFFYFSHFFFFFFFPKSFC